MAAENVLTNKPYFSYFENNLPCSHDFLSANCTRSPAEDVPFFNVYIFFKIFDVFLTEINVFLQSRYAIWVSELPDIYASFLSKCGCKNR